MGSYEEVPTHRFQSRPIVYDIAPSAPRRLQLVVLTLAVCWCNHIAAWSCGLQFMARATFRSDRQS